MAAWTCPQCDRSFGRTGQSHVCLPVMSVDAYFRDRPAYEVSKEDVAAPTGPGQRR